MYFVCSLGAGISVPAKDAVDVYVFDSVCICVIGAVGSMRANVCDIFSSIAAATAFAAAMIFMNKRAFVRAHLTHFFKRMTKFAAMAHVIELITNISMRTGQQKMSVSSLVVNVGFAGAYFSVQQGRAGWRVAIFLIVLVGQVLALVFESAHGGMIVQFLVQDHICLQANTTISACDFVGEQLLMQL